jgi:ubiquinone/menaquinone biosynthesis C-methylase UbiE
MSIRKDTIFERYLAPIFQLLIDGDELQRFSKQTDWQAVEQRYRHPDLTYPDYYLSQNFHGIERGYLNPGAAVSYDPITRYVLAPHETLVRQSLVEAVRCRPRRILDLGCGTGSTTVLLKQAFRDAEVMGLDLSPYMLFMAQRKAEAAGLEIAWCHGNAEHTGFAEASFDLVTASLLFHETPPTVAQTILREGFRLLTSGGELLILDGNQKSLRQMPWLNDIFEEPYIKAYGAGSLDASLGAAGFQDIRTEDIWWIHQVSRGVKPISAGVSRSAVTTELLTNAEFEEIPGPAFG